MALAPCQEDRLHGRRAAADGVGPRMRRQVEARHGRLPPDDEIQLRQLPRELHPGRHEAREGQGRARGGLRAHTGRAGVLRVRGDQRPGGLQGRLQRDRCQPLERRARGRGGQGVHEGFV